MSNKNEVFEYLIDQLRQQVGSNPYKQQCEDLAHEVLSLKNQLRDMSELVDELLGTITLMNGEYGCRKGNARECHHNWRFVNGKAPEVCVNCGVTKAEECEHDWVLDEKGDYFICAKCGKQEAELIDCRHTNTVGLRKGFAPGFTKKCLDCGAKLK